MARDWRMVADVGRQLVFPKEIATTTLRPDIVLWSPSKKKALIIELTVPWEDAVDEAFERKHLRYAELAAEAQQRGWNTEVRPVEVVQRVCGKVYHQAAYRPGNQRPRPAFSHQSLIRSSPKK